MSEFDTNDDAMQNNRPTAGEADDADAYEQHRDIADVPTNDPPHVPDDVNPADAIEQQLEVGMDDDAYDDY